MDFCGTCSMNDIRCPGHMGHIELPMPVYHPLWMRQLELLVRGSCFSCKKILEDTVMSEHVLCMIRLIDADLWDKLEGLRAIFCESESTASTKTIANMREYVERMISENPNAGKSAKASRFINHSRAQLMSEYMSAAFKTRKGHCNHCLVPLRKLRQEHHIRMFFDEGASKRGIEKAKRALVARKKSHLKPRKRKGRTKKQLRLDGEEEEDDGFEEGDVDDVEGSTHVLEKPTQEDIDIDELETKMLATQNRAMLTPAILRQHMRAVWDNNSHVLKAVCGMLQVPLEDDEEYSGDERPTDIFFLSVIPVTATKFRPVAKRGGVMFENPLNLVYCKMLDASDQIKLALKSLKDKELDPNALVEAGTKKTQAYDSLYKNMTAMQQAVNNVLDSDLNKMDSGIRPPGVRQIIEKKQGLFRKHMMGKRVDFAARSVISPDPFISVDEIGIPEVFAKRLTFPEPVNVHNVERLRRAVINGPNKHPGATHVINESGVMTHLSADMTQRQALSRTLLTLESSGLNHKPKTVCRHLCNGDMLLLNRQPTLHRPSIQAHKAHVLPAEKTIRLHYANCNAYNADFDGDEMNAHFPQSFMGQSEAREIVTTNKQYLVPKNGTPLAGLIQDHVIGGVTLCMRGRFFNKMDYQQLVFSGLVNQQTVVRLLPPAIIKPIPMWTGKQVISTVLRNLLPVDSEDLYINLQGRSKITGNSWLNSLAQIDSVPQLGEETVVFRQGHLVQGVLDKNHYGASQNGLVHSCYELYGGKISSELLSSLARLFTNFLKNRGFTIGVQDILCQPAADASRARIMENGATLGDDAVALALGITADEEEEQTADLVGSYMAAHFDSDDMKMKEIDLSMKQISDSIQNDITRATMPQGLLKKFPDNNLQLMVVAGAKGSTVNCMQISGLLGQIELEGRRPPITRSGRSLPSFRPYDTSPRAGGFVDGRFLTGIKPQEYFFHCMAGREGLVDTAVKTSRSGYLQRCLVKHLEGIVVEYDSTVRDSDGSVVQFEFGDDSLSVLNTNLLKTQQFPFLIANHKTAAGQQELSRLREVLDRKKARRWDKKIAQYKKTWAEFSDNERRSPYLKFTDSQTDAIKCATEPINTKLHRSDTAKNIEKSYREMSADEREEYEIYSDTCPEPTMHRYPPSKYLHSLPERLRNELDKYKDSNPHQLLVDEEDESLVPYGKISTDQLEEIISLYSCRGRVEPGESVGILAAQSIGEPSTQMTLNTFHFAGRGEMNVTLGIPRLREILMVASKQQKTPSMDIPFKPTKYAQKRAKNLQLKLNTVRLSHMLEKTDVSTNLITKWDCGKLYTVFLQFLPPSQYIGKCLLTPKAILAHVERSFVPAVARSYAKATRLNADIKLLNAIAGEKEPTKYSNADLDNREEEEDQAPDLPGEDADEMEEMVREAGNDYDAAADKDLKSRDEEREYDGEEDEIAELLGDDNTERDDSSEGDGESTMSSDDADSANEEYTIDKLDALSAKKRLKRSRRDEQEMDMNADRVANVQKVPGVHKYVYDVDEELWCEITFKYPLSNSDVDMTPIVQMVAETSLVCDPEKLVRGVNKAILSQPKNPNDPIRLRTEGVNIQRMFQYERILDLPNLYTNDIHAMADTYGIEAARSVLIKEVRDVFAAYGIVVDYRHLSLIADYMTYDGQYKAFNRTGLLPHASALQKMTYEASTMFLKQTMLSGVGDDLDSPSARIVVGRPVKVGTGSFDCVVQFGK